MKLEEAASILGVHPDTPIETLKQTYRRLALAWHPDKVRLSEVYFESLTYANVVITSLV